MKRIISVILMMAVLFSLTVSCSEGKEKVLIYTSAEEYSNVWFQEKLNEKFPDYEIILTYMSSGNHAAKLKAEGLNTDCDISLELEYGYLENSEIKDMLADLSSYDMSIFMDDLTDKDKKYMPTVRQGGAIIVNTEKLSEKGLTEPASYQDLLKSEYKGLISMPNPKTSGTGYMFLKSLVNEWGEEEAFSYFDKLAENILQFTSSGSGPVNALVQGEVVIGLGMTGDAVQQISKGEKLKILYFNEGSPYNRYGSAIIKGKETRECVKEVFDYFYAELIEGNSKLYFPEKVYKNKDFEIENFPQNIVYADMSNNTTEIKDDLLSKWTHG